MGLLGFPSVLKYRVKIPGPVPSQPQDLEACRCLQGPTHSCLGLFHSELYPLSQHQLAATSRKTQPPRTPFLTRTTPHPGRPSPCLPPWGRPWRGIPSGHSCRAGDSEWAGGPGGGGGWRGEGARRYF